MDRRELLTFAAAAAAAGLAPSLNAFTPASSAREHPATAEQWGLFELALAGPTAGNPFKDVSLRCSFQLEHRTVTVTGFYDGDGTYRVRFMPDAAGRWTYTTASSAAMLDGHSGSFVCSPPQTPGNHGPVGVAHQFHFQYADGTPYFPFGTTNYAYLCTSEANAELTLAELKRAGFNKTRICVLPKPLGKGKQSLPFPDTGAQADGRSGTSDLTRFNPAYFQTLERRLLELQKAGIEADLILFHPYDGWGYKAMPPEVDDFYLKYVIARLSAFRNVWWSVANEFDLIKAKTLKDWDRFFRIIQAEDPYSHLRSIHHSKVIYDHSKAWCTHASLQSYDFEKSAERRQAWGKPIIYDEIQYEGDIERRWGNLSPEEMTRRFWLAIIHGAYATHGDIFISATGESSFADAGRLQGESAPRIAFLRSLLEQSSRAGLTEYEGSYYLSAGLPNELYLYYFDFHRPARYDFPLPTSGNFSATLIDPYNMTTTPLPGTFIGKSRIALPGKPHQAVLFRKVSNAAANTPAVVATPEVQD